MSGFAPPATWFADLSAMISQIFGQYWPILLLICGLSLGFFILEVLLNLARPRSQIVAHFERNEDDEWSVDRQRLLEDVMDEDD